MTTPSKKEYEICLLSTHGSLRGGLERKITVETPNLDRKTEDLVNEKIQV